jgi:DNA-binding NarL/FixJ family response regulator
MKKLRIVILDDHADSRKLLQILFEKIKECDVIEEFSNPLEFLAAEKGLGYDVLISDVEMPEIKGIDLVSNIKKQIIFVTGESEVYVKELLAAGIEAPHVIGTIPKPVKLEILEKAIQKCISNMPINVISETINFRTRSGFAPIRISTIQCIAMDKFSEDLKSKDRKAGKGNKWLYRTNDSPIEILDCTIEKLIRDLPQNEFCQISDSEIIHKSAIAYFSKQDVILKLKTIDRQNEKEVEVGIGDKYRTRFKEFVGG